MLKDSRRALVGTRRRTYAALAEVDARTPTGSKTISSVAFLVDGVRVGDPDAKAGFTLNTPSDTAADMFPPTMRPACRRSGARWPPTSGYRWSCPTGRPGRCIWATISGRWPNRVRLQQIGVELFVLVADYQVLTDRGQEPRQRHRRVLHGGRDRTADRARQNRLQAPHHLRPLKLALKRLAIEAVNEFLCPIRACRAAYFADRAHLRQILKSGNERAIAHQTFREVRTAMKTPADFSH